MGRLTADELERRVEQIRHELRTLIAELVYHVSDEGDCPDTHQPIEQEDEILGHVGLQAALDCLPERTAIGNRDNFADALDQAEAQRARQAGRNGN
jgi:hypothetical protein